MVTMYNIFDFDLDNTVTCGQIFRYNRNADKSYTIVIHDRVINVKQEGTTLYVKSNNYFDIEETIISYFDLRRNYEQMNKAIIRKDKKIKTVVESCIGFKIIRQQPFETVISYIISATNNVFRISNSVDLISKKWGTPVIFENTTYYLFPTLQQLSDVSVEEFRTCGVGFRDVYIFSFIDKLKNKEIDLNKFYYMDKDLSMKLFMENEGIGPKVASCILLMAYGRFDVYPVDTWVKKAFKLIYGTDKVKDIRRISEEVFTEYSGLVIQYMFHYMRNIK